MEIVYLGVLSTPVNVTLVALMVLTIPLGTIWIARIKKRDAVFFEKDKKKKKGKKKKDFSYWPR